MSIVTLIQCTMTSPKKNPQHVYKMFFFNGDGFDFVFVLLTFDVPLQYFVVNQQNTQKRKRFSIKASIFIFFALLLF